MLWKACLPSSRGGVDSWFSLSGLRWTWRLAGSSDGRRGRWVRVIHVCFGGSVLHFCKMTIRQIFFLFFIKKWVAIFPKLCKKWPVIEISQKSFKLNLIVLSEFGTGKKKKKKGNCLGGKKTPDGQKSLWGTGTCKSPLLIYLCYPLPCPSLSPLLPACPLSGSLFLHPASHRVPRCDAEICSLTMAELWKQLYTRRMKGFLSSENSPGVQDLHHKFMMGWGNSRY